MGSPLVAGVGRWRPVLECWSCPCLIISLQYSYSYFHMMDYPFQYVTASIMLGRSGVNTSRP